MENKVELKELIQIEGGLQTKQKSDSPELSYGIEDVPPWHISLLMGFQHYIVIFSSFVLTPIIFASALCLPIDGAEVTYIGNTIFLVSAFTTSLQTVLGVRLPIVQGPSAAFLMPMFTILSQPQWKCPNIATGMNISGSDENNTWFLSNNNTETVDVDEVWKSRMREIQGCVILASVFQILVSMFGLVAFIVPYIGPLTIAPTISLIGFSLFPVVLDFCTEQWGITILTVIIITIFSQYLQGVKVPCECVGDKSKTANKSQTKMPIIAMFSIILAILVLWLFCFILTISGAIGDNENDIGYMARTDLKYEGLAKTHWFRVPYPFQWGMPTYSVAGVLGMSAAPIASMIESIGDYYTCARDTGAPPPPSHAINRGLLVEGVGCVTAGIWGAGLGLTSFSTNIAAMRITKVGSRRVILVTSVLMLITAVFGKLSAVFIMIPTPIIGGVCIVLLGLVISVGMAHLHTVDLSSSRNIYILGISLFIGLSVPYAIQGNPEVINTGVVVLDQIFLVLLQSSMILGGVIGFVLDNTIPGTLTERGIILPTKDVDSKEYSQSQTKLKCYDIPGLSRCLNRFPATAYFPISPNFKGWFNK